MERDGWRISERLPDIGLVLRIVDLIIEQGRGLVSQGHGTHVSRPSWTLRDLVAVREQLDGLIIKAVLVAYLEQFAVQGQDAVALADVKTFYTHELFLDYLYRLDPQFGLISLNYDLFLERAATQHLAPLYAQPPAEQDATPAYNVPFEAPFVDNPSGRLLLKLHGSMDWGYCGGCGRVRLFQTQEWLAKQEGRQATGSLKDGVPTTLNQLAEILLDPYRAARCADCGGDLRPMIIPPTLAKNYANSHIRRIWSHAEHALRNATALWFVGYSLPVDDIVVITSLKQNTQHIRRDQIRVIVPDEAAAARYRSVFGPEIRVSASRFEEWVARHQDEIPTFRAYENYPAARAAAEHGRSAA